MHKTYFFQFVVKAGHTRDVRQQLDAYGKFPNTPRGSHPDLPFNRIPNLHFASLTLFEADPAYGNEVILELNIDGPLKAFLPTLIHYAGAGLHAICSYCEGYGGPDQLYDYLWERRKTPTLRHIGNYRRSLSHILSERALRDRLDCELDELRKSYSKLTPQEVRAALRKRVDVPTSSRWAPVQWFFDYREKSTSPWIPEWQRLKPFKRMLKLLAVIPGLLAWGIATLLQRLIYKSGRTRRWNLSLDEDLGLDFVTQMAHWARYGWAFLISEFFNGVSALWNYLFGKTQAAGIIPPETRAQRDHLKEVVNREDLEDCLQNHLASIVTIRGGYFSTLWLRIKLTGLQIFYKVLFTQGTLAGVPGIHFAHWTLLRGHHGKPTRLLFLSNYDGTWDGYLDDFIQQLLEGVAAIWGQSVGFPGRNGDNFKRWARQQQAVRRVWYSAYPDLTVDVINNNTVIRRGLFKNMTDASTRSWLRRFGQVLQPRLEGGSIERVGARTVSGALELTDARKDVQGLVFQGYAHLTHAAYLFLQFHHQPEEPPDAARAWLERLLPRVTHADRAAGRAARAVNVAFTESGLRRLGLTSDDLDGFPTPFQEGMVTPHRSRILGDTGNNQPEAWAWGSDQNRVDVLLMLFESDQISLKAAIKSYEAPFEAGLGSCVHRILSSDLKGHEHFGFRDGLSQPIIEGTPSADALHPDEKLWHVVKPGEFILGHVDGTGRPSDMPRLALANGSPSFGRNGSYLVARQLAQHVSDFWTFIDQQIQEKRGGPSGDVRRNAQDEIAALMVGRHPNGKPLAQTPVLLQQHQHTNGNELANRTRKDNAFGFRDDQDGFVCPIGAHVRRANPRDLLGLQADEALRAANRHRILRRGRPYGVPVPDRFVDDGSDRGLLFMCLNSDIERQFEFVQHRWINNPVFDGLYQEPDPLVGPRCEGPQCATRQKDPVRNRMTGLPNFIQVKGGAYFFLPALSALKYLAQR